MAALELFLGMAIAGLGGVLAAVGLQAYRATGVRRMAVVAAAFAAAALGGAAYLSLLLTQGESSGAAPVALALGQLGALALFYFALFGKPT